ncbi:ABC transporter ATP-binding protein [Alicyclobacillus macrosporangiidus]|jgi:NitT/TauT family transport system ATP-binding protein|uniref:Carnitine transport ATP-binding protein OpuCA n=1 Tax=Alicyclobacillus macrosporangiidus TaxID=392015 RepID=A0A1I7K8P5_9BACL|nr:ABC transporter ATP-binding protein [Alicyclobacillus macrosporangiidus]SFU93814.1 NitT/TauT family transport system ATP-binding protein [Alicyclobacillus macrosporangiidus]
MRLVVDGVSKVYRDRRGRETVALDDIHLTVAEQEFVAIVGPSGCGKSTLLSMVAGLTEPTRGQIFFEGAAGRSPRIGVVFQEHALFPWRTVQRNVEFGLEQLGMPKRERSERAREMIRKVGLQGFEDKYPHQLSGGMRQRVGIARAFVIEPDVLLMDEPLSALDAQSRLIMQEELLNLWESVRQKTLYVTHNIEEAVALADRVVVLSRRPGRVVRVVDIDVPRAARKAPEAQVKLLGFADAIWQTIRHDAEQALVEG